MVGKPIKFGEYDEDIGSIAYDPEGRFLAVGAFDGSIKFFNSFTGKLQMALNPPNGPEDEPVSITKVRWRPQYQNGTLKASSILASICSNGLIQHWSLSSGKEMPGAQITTHRDNGNSLSAMDYTCDGRKLCVAGEDRKVYVYDESSNQLVSTMHGRGFKVHGHKNRILALRCHPENFNLIVSGGWDGSIKIYDLRDSAPVGSIGGPQCSGDSIDLFDDMIVAGSNRNREVMQMFSLSAMRKIHTWDYNANSKDAESGYVLSTRFSNDGNFIFAGGAGHNELRVYNNNCDTTANYKLQMEIKELPDAVYTIDVNPNPDIKQFAFGLGNGQIMAINYDFDQNNTEFQPYQGDFSRVAYDIVALEELKKKQRSVMPLSEITRMAYVNI